MKLKTQKVKRSVLKKLKIPIEQPIRQDEPEQPEENASEAESEEELDSDEEVSYFLFDLTIKLSVNLIFVNFKASISVCAQTTQARFERAIGSAQKVRKRRRSHET